MTAVTSDHARSASPQLSEKSAGKPVKIGTGFSATSFRHTGFGGLMDPLIMVDHFVMTERTFETHAHAGLSAVTIIFEDSEGLFRNRDSLGNDIDLEPGDLYWLKAAKGAVHDEATQRGGRTHALQVFVNLPAAMKHDAPAARHVPASSMPKLMGLSAEARLVLGQSGDVQGASSPALPMNILDVSLSEDGQFMHSAASSQSAWVYAVNGDVSLVSEERNLELRSGQAVAIGGAARLTLRGLTRSHAVILQGRPIREDFVQRGPFAMSTSEDLDAVEADYRAGRLGSLN